MKYKVIHRTLCLFFALFLCLSLNLLADQKLTHIVKRGDTLWSICEQYYGDPYLWPELWEMNQFVTNPHWLKPGDTITLFKDREIVKKPEPKKRIVEPKKLPAIKKATGIDVSSLANTKALGFFHEEKLQPQGKIFDFKTEKILISQNDTVYLKIYEGNPKPGDTFTVYTIRGPVRHPLTKKGSGYIYSFKGIIEIEKDAMDYYIATIRESFGAINKDDFLMPHYPVASCITPVSCKTFIKAYILAAKDNLTVLGQYSVVYISAGSDKGVREGNIFEVIEERESLVEPLDEKTVTLPPAVLGKILVLKTMEDTSVGVVFWAVKNFSNGATVRSLTWRKQPVELANLPACPIE